MAVNKYDRPAEHKFINTYSPIPFAELAAAGQARQNRLDENLGRLDAAQAAANQINYIPNSVDQKRVEEIQTGLSNIADQFIDQDLSDPEIYRKLRRGMREVVDPNEIKAIEGSFQGWQNYNKMAAQMKSKGEQIYKPYDFANYSTKDTGIFTDLPTMDLGDKARATIDAFMKRPQVIDKPYFEEQSQRWGTRKERELGQIYDLIQNNTDELIADPAIQQFMEKNGLDKAGMQKYLADLAPNYQVMDIQNLAWAPGYGDDTKTPDPIYPSTSYAGAVTPAGTQGGNERKTKKQVPKVKDIYPDVKKVKAEGYKTAKEHFGQGLQDALSEADRRGASFEEIREIKDKYRTYNQEQKGTKKELEFKTEEDKIAFNEQLESAAKYYYGDDFDPLSIGANDKIDLVEDYLQYKWTHQRNPEVVEFTESYRPEESKVLKNQIEITTILDNRAVYDPTKPMDQDLMSVLELKEEYPTTKYDWVPIGETVDIPNENLALAKQVVIRDKDTGESKGEFFVAGSGQEIASSRFDNALTKEIMYSDKSRGSFAWPISDTQNANVSWNIKERVGELPEYSVLVEYPDGTGIGPISAKNMGDLRNKLLENMAYFGQ